MDYYNELKQAATYIESLGYYPIYVCLAGSQNYGLNIETDSYHSDLDFKCVVLPRLEDLVQGKEPVSISVSYNDGFIDLKDIRAFMSALFKCNPSYIEALYTPHCLAFNEGVELFTELRDHRTNLVRDLAIHFVKALCGSFVKIKAGMRKKECEYLFGDYDGKSASHLYRLLVLLRNFYKTGDVVLLPSEEDRKFMSYLKLSIFPKSFVQSQMEAWDKEMMCSKRLFEKNLPPITYETKDYLRNVVYNTLFSFMQTEEGLKRKETQWNTSAS